MNKQGLGAMEIFQLVVIFLILMINYIGFTYLVDGNFLISLFLSAAIFGLYLVSHNLISNKINKGSILKNNYLSFYSIFFIILLLLFILNWFLTAHTYNIMTNCKESLKAESIHKIDHIRESIADYKKRYQKDFNQLGPMTANMLRNYVFSPNAQSKQALMNPPYNISESTLRNPGNINIEAIKNNVLKQVQAEHNIQTIDSALNKELDQINKVFDNYTLFKLANNYTNLNKNLKQILKTLNEKVIKLPYNNQPIQMEFEKNALDLSSPMILAKKFKLGLFIPLLIAFILNGILFARYINVDPPEYEEPKNNSKKSEKGPIIY